MSDTALPATVDLLITLLDKTFPLQNFPRTADLSSVHRACGARDVVDFLRTLQRERNAPEE